MKFSYQWLKDILNFKESPEELAGLLTMFFAETQVERKNKRPILEIDILPNRAADASCHLGLAREISAICGKRFYYPKISFKEGKNKINNFLEIKIKNKECQLYLARVILDILVDESPKWLKERLEDCGIRPINNVVDAANYVMLLTGQPLHIFDFDKVSFGKKKKTIIIRQAKKGEKITTLENKDYLLDESAMVVADEVSPLALAGIKGGEKAEVTKATKNIILESANFKSSSIRQTSKKLGLSTDASWRFERGLDLDLAEYAINGLAELILKLAGGEAMKNFISKKSLDVSKKKSFIPIGNQSWEKFLGWPIKINRIVKNLELLGFDVKKKNDYLLAVPPHFRIDIKTKEDVMGEAARIFGFNKLPSFLPKEFLSLPEENEFWFFKEKIKDWLEGYHLEEVYNYSFISEQDKTFLPEEWKEKLIEIENPTSDLAKFLRPTLLLGFLKNLNYNFNFADELGFFEIGKKFFKEDDFFKEIPVFSGILAKGEKGKTPIFYQTKGIIEGLFNSWGIDKDDYAFKNLSSEKGDYVSLISEGAVIFSRDKFLGVLGYPKEKLIKSYGLEGKEMVFWELNLENLIVLVREEIEFQSLPKYPAVIRDISIFLERKFLVDEILEIIQKAAPDYLEDVDLFDVYEGKGLPFDKKSLSFHLVFRSKDDTLKSKEVEKEMEKIFKALKKIGAEIR